LANGAREVGLCPTSACSFVSSYYGVTFRKNADFHMLFYSAQSIQLELTHVASL